EEGVDGHRHDEGDVGGGGASPPVDDAEHEGAEQPAVGDAATPRASTTMLPSSERNIVAGALNARPQPMVAQRATRSPCRAVIGAARMPASSRPDKPAGRASMMNSGKISSSRVRPRSLGAMPW